MQSIVDSTLMPMPGTRACFRAVQFLAARVLCAMSMYLSSCECAEEVLAWERYLHWTGIIKAGRQAAAAERHRTWVPPLVSTKSGKRNIGHPPAQLQFPPWHPPAQLHFPPCASPFPDTHQRQPSPDASSRILKGTCSPAVKSRSPLSLISLHNQGIHSFNTLPPVESHHQFHDCITVFKNHLATSNSPINHQPFTTSGGGLIYLFPTTYTPTHRKHEVPVFIRCRHAGFDCRRSLLARVC